MIPNQNFKGTTLLFDVECLRNDRRLLQSKVVCDLLNCAIVNDLDPPSRSFQRFCLKTRLAYLPVSDPGDLMTDDIADDLERPLKVISGTVNDKVFQKR